MNFDEFMNLFWRLLSVAVLVSLNGFFVAAEFALVKVRLTQLDPVAQARVPDPLATRCEHLRALVDADQAPVRDRAGELDRHGGRSARDVEDFARVGWNPRDEERAPARVLPE